MLCQSNKADIDRYLTDYKDTLTKFQSEEKKRIDLEQKVKHLEEIIIEKDKELKNDKYHIIRFANKSLDRTNMNNNNINSNNTTFMVNMMSKDLFENLIDPPTSQAMDSTSLYKLLSDRGIGNHYRITDESRKIVLWVKPEDGEIKDKCGEDMCDFIVNNLIDQLKIQQDYCQTKLNEYMSPPIK